LAGRAADRRRHRVLRGAVLRDRAADGAGDGDLTALALDRVSVELGGRDVVSEATFAVEPGEWVALLGPNGAGKTALFRAISGLVRHRGEIAIAGERAAKLGRREIARRVAVVPQSPAMPAGLTVREYVLLGRTPYVSYMGSESRHDHA